MQAVLNNQKTMSLSGLWGEASFIYKGNIEMTYFRGFSN